MGYGIGTGIKRGSWVLLGCDWSGSEWGGGGAWYNGTGRRLWEGES